jgi:hypothetical protein
LDRRLGGAQSRSGSGGEEKNSQPLPGLEPPIIQPVAQLYTDTGQNKILPALSSFFPFLVYFVHSFSLSLSLVLKSN